MKMMFFYPVVLLAALIVIVTLKSNRSASAQDRPAEVSLPNSCTLMSMNPTERAVHLKRLGMLRRGMSGVKVSKEGFNFEIDLQKMSLGELKGWAENEQKCCSELKINIQNLETDKRAVVRVVCDDGLKTEIMQTLGLKGGT